MPSEKYKILRVLNTKGTVHLAADESGRKVVLKTLSPDSVSMYRRIAELPPHSYLERVFGCIEQDENPVAVCEYIEGQTLREFLESGRTFSLNHIKKLTCDLCLAVEHLHKNNIIHRDINPNNIMLDDKLNLKLIDYSIARPYSGRKDSDTTIFGTEGYSAPEQYGFKETRFTADVYSIGRVLKMLLNSSVDGSAAQEVYLRKIAAKCSSFDSDSRYKSTSAVHSAIKRSGYILPVAIGCTVLASMLVFTSGVLMLIRDKEHSNNSSPIHTASTVTTVSAATSTIPSITSPVTTTATTTSPVTTITEASTESVTSTAATTVTTTTATTMSTAASTTKHTTTATTVQTTTAASTTTAPAFQLPEYLELFTLKGSDLDNPNKITVTPVQDENGHYTDSFEYDFYDDPAVHGEWVYCNLWMLNGAKLPATAEGIMNYEHWGASIIDKLTIYSDGIADIYCDSNTGEPTRTKWTNGYIIIENGDGIFAQRLFAVTIDDTEFLFMESKSGDYLFRGEINCYYIFVRKE